MSERAAIRAAAWEAPLKARPALTGVDRRTLSEVLWTLALTEMEAQILLGYSDILNTVGELGEIGVIQGTQRWLQDALGQWRRTTYGDIDPTWSILWPSPSMTSFLGQFLGCLWYWDRYCQDMPLKETMLEDGPLRLPATHNAGPDGWEQYCHGGPPDLIRYMDRFSHFWEYRETLWDGRVQDVKPYRKDS